MKNKEKKKISYTVTCPHGKTKEVSNILLALLAARLLGSWCEDCGKSKGQKGSILDNKKARR